MFEAVAIKVLQAAANVKRAAELLGLSWDAMHSIKVAARGFRNFANYRLRVLFYCGKLEMAPDGCHEIPRRTNKRR
jgi:hypothetical protein